MRAIVIHDAKDLRIEERTTPDLKSGQVKIRLATGGICGSDLHYYHHGGFGTVRLKEPMILGHEVSGFVEDMADDVAGLNVGDLVAVSPSRPCNACQYCLRGLPNHCQNMRFYGSAMPFPHIQGAFRETLIADVSQCVPATGLSAGEAAMAEPLAVTLHATRRAGDMLGKRVLITGSGPIGTLATLSARAAGATEVVVTDIEDQALTFAAQVGADRTINVATEPEKLDEYTSGKGYFDVHYECAGRPETLATGVAALAPRGIILQLGLGGDMSVPVQALTAKELDLRGSFRFHEEFATAVSLMRSGQIDVKPLISHTVPLEDAVAGFELAGDRKQAMKTQIEFTTAME
ncbi:MAG: L-idonate 5-dehydrogenase [Boseongicola sp.]|nr:L-idonate 5-dehydrogenase [Boseongicola sp.]MDD9978528.1 L-idonate 5-dehydrogenase [Boseongicola sp.]